MGGGRVSADTAVVKHGGKRTAATGAAWANLGSQTRTTLTEAKGALKDDPSELGAAIQTFATSWVPKLTKIGDDVSNLGTNAHTAGVRVDTNDSNAATTQTPPRMRPVNGGRIPV